MDIKFYKCRHCGQIVSKLVDKNVPLVCCGEKMEELIPNSTDASKEKHVPVIAQEGNKVVVKVGAVAHPMTEEHYIQWILLSTNKGNQRKVLTPADKPEATFYLAEGEKVDKAFAYCNLHGLFVK